MDRIQRKVKYFDRTWTLLSLFPADFLEVSCWPFAYYRLSEVQRKENFEVKRDWKLKPKNVSSEEEKLESAIKQAIMQGASIANEDYEAVKADDTLYSLLLAEIYALTYQLDLTEKYFTPTKTISKDFAEALAIKSKAMNCEPYALIADILKEKPELYNPKRYDFNWLVLSAGWERERIEMIKAQNIAKSKMRTH